MVVKVSFAVSLRNMFFVLFDMNVLHTVGQKSVKSYGRKCFCVSSKAGSNAQLLSLSLLEVIILLLR